MVKNKPTRKFLGKLFPERQEANFEKAHLRGYLKGHKVFPFGKYVNGQQMYHEVKQQLIW